MLGWSAPASHFREFEELAQETDLAVPQMLRQQHFENFAHKYPPLVGAGGGKPILIICTKPRINYTQIKLLII